MSDIDKYMIPLNSIQSTPAYNATIGILYALLVGMGTAIIAAFIASICLGGNDDAVPAVMVTVGTIVVVLMCYWIFQSGWAKRIDTSKINDEYGITVTSMDGDGTEQDGESQKLSYLRDGTMVHGTLIVKDNKAGLLAGTGDKLTPVKPKSVGNANASPTTSKATDSHANASKPNKSARSSGGGCYAKSYNRDGSIRELAGDCPATATH